MISGYGWCILHSAREPYSDSAHLGIDATDAIVDVADRELWVAFQAWLESNPSPWLKCHFHERLNMQTGILLFCVSRNHRSSPVWDMIEWIASNGPGSYGLFFVHDDEDFCEVNPVYDYPISRNSLPNSYDHTNMFRVHRIANGKVTELEDPFFGPIVPNLEPHDPCDIPD